MEEKKKDYFKGGENGVTAKHLQDGETCIVVGVGNSMEPLLKSGQPVLMEPVTETTELNKDDVVLAKAKGCDYCHKISAMKSNGQIQISNNSGHVNGWVSRNAVFGRMIKIL